MYHKCKTYQEQTCHYTHCYTRGRAQLQRISESCSCFHSGPWCNQAVNSYEKGYEKSLLHQSRTQFSWLTTYVGVKQKVSSWQVRLPTIKRKFWDLCHSDWKRCIPKPRSVVLCFSWYPSPAFEKWINYNCIIFSRRQSTRINVERRC